MLSLVKKYHFYVDQYKMHNNINRFVNKHYKNSNKNKIIKNLVYNKILKRKDRIKLKRIIIVNMQS